MLIKSKNPPKAAEPQTQEVPVVLTPALEDIDYIVGAYGFAEARISLENLQIEVAHASDIAVSLEQLDMVLESLTEIDMGDAALIHAVGDVAGASCGMSGRLFTPSLEDVADPAPALQERIKAIYEAIAKYVRMIVAKIGAYISMFFAKSHEIAKSYEKLGDKIRSFNYNESSPVTMADVPGAAGGPKSLIPALSALNKAAQEVINTAPQIFATQIQFVQLADSKGVDGVFQDLQSIEQLSMTAGRGLTMAESGDETSNPVMLSKPFLNGVQLRVEVFDYDAAGKDFSTDLVRRAFHASTGFIMSNDEAVPRQSTFTMSHELAKDCYDALRPLITMMVDPDSPQSYHKVSKDIHDTMKGIDSWLHMHIQNHKAGANPDPRLLQLYETGLKHLTTGQMAAVILSHKLLCDVSTVVTDYLSSCLRGPKKAAPQRAPEAGPAPVTTVV